MKLKHFLSAALALVMVLSLSIPVFAADYETSVSYEGTGTEQYELTVPSQLKPGTAGNVTLSGTWASNRHIAVTADESVTMTGSLGGSETLDVTFAGIDLAGNNETSVSETKQVSVEELNALFGNWTGTFYYNVGASSSSSGSGNDDGATVPATDWSSKVVVKNITSGEYDLLCEATNEDDSLMHWNKMRSITDTVYFMNWNNDENASYRVVRGYSSAQNTGNYGTTTQAYHGGFRPAFEALTPATDCANLSVGDVVVMGTLYVGDSAIKVPATPTDDGDITAYDEDGAGVTSKITLSSALQDTNYQVKAVYVGDGLFVCDRVVLNYISWNQITAALS